MPPSRVRRRIPALLALVLATTVLAPTVLTGCSPDPLPPEPFSTVTLNETGGVDGRDNLLAVDPDGTALLLGADPQAGSLSPDRMHRIEELVTGTEFRTEAATEPPDSDRCSDQVVRTVRMGSLLMGRSMTCRSPLDRTPAFDELVGLLEIEDALPSDAPRLQEMEIVHTAGPDSEEAGRRGSFVLSANGDWTARGQGEDGTAERGTLGTDEQDAVRLLQARLAGRGPVPVAECEPAAGEQVITLADRDYHLNPCQPTRDDRELRSLWTVIADAADLLA